MPESFTVGGLPSAAERSTAFDDRFEAGALAPWWVNPTVSVIPVSLAFASSGNYKGLTIQPTLTNKRMNGIRMAAPAGGFTVMAQLIANGPNDADIRAGIFAAIPGGKGHVTGPFNQGTCPGYIGATTANDTSDWSSFDGTSVNGPGSITVLRWFRIVWNTSGAIAFDHSLDRVTWTSITSRAGMSQPTEIGVGIYSQSSAAQTNASITIARWIVV